ncbi:MAG TPA: hypothetical protein VFF03_19150 [Rhodocyclaceae bacterium]|nr:hypothetical protein [Rhodocyclaceae bacterium]
MQTSTPTAAVETRIPSGFILLAYGLLGLLAPLLPLPSGTPFSLDGLPSRVAWLCAPFAAIVILTSLGDQSDGEKAIGLYRRFGRWFWWAGLFTVALSLALAVTRTTFADDLLRRDRQAFVALVTLGIFAFLAFLSQRSSASGQAEEEVSSPPSSNRLKAVLAIVLTAIAGFLLYQRYQDKKARDAGYEAQDTAERRAASPWHHDMTTFRSGQSVEEVRAVLRGSGHSLRCFNDLRSENRLQEDDRTNCWAMIGQAWDAPARSTVFWFGDEGLRNHMLRFPEGSWPQVEKKLDAMGQRLPYPVGRDPDSGGPVIGWRLDSGIIMSAAPAPGTEISVLWTAKGQVARLHCPQQSARGQRGKPGEFALPVAQLWPEIDCRDFGQ